MKRPIINYFQRQIVLKTNSHLKNVILFEIAKLKFKRELSKLFEPIFNFIFKPCRNAD